MKKEDRLPDLAPETFPDRRIKLILDNMGTKHSLIINKWVLLLLVILFVSGIVLLGITSWRGSDSRESERIKKLETENKFLVNKLDNFENELDSIKVKLDATGSFPEPKTTTYPYFSDGESTEVNHLRVNPGLAVKLSNIDHKLTEIKLRVGLEAELTLSEINLPAGFVTRGDGIPSIYPTFGSLSDGWGMRISPFTQEPEFHTGWDIANKTGTPVYATADGIVTKAHFEEGYGKVIIIGHAEGYKTLYGHLYSIRVSLGEAVHKGQIIALMGTTGMSTGPHLHYGVSRNGEALNPSSYLNRIDETYTARR